MDLYLPAWDQSSPCWHQRALSSSRPLSGPASALVAPSVRRFASWPLETEIHLDSDVQKIFSCSSFLAPKVLEIFQNKKENEFSRKINIKLFLSFPIIVNDMTTKWIHKFEKNHILNILNYNRQMLHSLNAEWYKYTCNWYIIKLMLSRAIVRKFTHETFEMHSIP